MNQAMLNVPLTHDIRSENSLNRGFSPCQHPPFHLTGFGFLKRVPSSKVFRLWGRVTTKLCLTFLLTAPTWAFPYINADGKKVEVAPNLEPRKPAVVFFHAPWSKTSSRYQVELESWEAKQTDYTVLGVQVKNLTSPVAKQYGVTSVPWFVIYDEEGQISSCGQPALQEVLKLMKETP